MIKINKKNKPYLPIPVENLIPNSLSLSLRSQIHVRWGLTSYPSFTSARALKQDERRKMRDEGGKDEVFVYLGLSWVGLGWG